MVGNCHHFCMRDLMYRGILWHGVQDAVVIMRDMSFELLAQIQSLLITEQE